MTCAMTANAKKTRKTFPILLRKGTEMRRLKKLIEQSMVSSQDRYIKTRIEQLEQDMEKAHDEHDKMWYNRCIQELNWALQMSGKPTHNCYMEGEKEVWT